MRSYEAARNLFGFFGYCSTFAIFVGGVLAIGGAAAIGNAFGRDPNVLQFALAALPGIAVSALGLFGLAMVQIGRSGVDTAEYAQQSLDVSRQHLELTKQSLELSISKAATYAGAAPAGSALAPAPGQASNADTQSSYANKPELAASQTSDPTLPNNKTPQLENTPEMTVDDMLPNAAPGEPIPEVARLGGSYLVGKMAFKTKRDAIDYRKSLSHS